MNKIKSTFRLIKNIFISVQGTPKHLRYVSSHRNHIITSIQKFYEIDTIDHENHAKGFTKKLLNSTINGINIVTLLKEMCHFGVLEKDLLIQGASKYTYTNLQLKNSILFKNQNPGMGLSSHGKLKDHLNKTEEIKHNNRNISVLEIIQSYSIILNLGHLFGTFATERGLLYYDQKTSENILEKIIHQVESKLSPKANERMIQIKESESLFHLYILLAMYRISLIDQDDIKDACFKIVNFMHEETDTSRKAMWAFRSIRQISYHELHSIIFTNGSLNISDYSELIKTFRQDPNIGYNPIDDNKNTTQNLMTYMDEYQNITHFSSAKSAQTILEHINEYRTWWNNRKSFRPIELNDLPFIRPIDWPSNKNVYIEDQSYQHLLRIEIFIEKKWIQEQITWTADYTLWNSINFIITPLPKSTATTNLCIIDLYKKSQASLPNNNLIFFLAQKLEYSNQKAIQNQNPQDIDNRKTWRSISRFFIKLIEIFFLKTNYTCYIEPIQCRDNHVAYATIYKGKNLSQEIEKFDWLTDQRKAELSHINEIECHINENSYNIIILGSLKIVADTNNEIGEIDIAVISITNENVLLVIGETKQGVKQGSGAKQIRKLQGILNKDSTVHPQDTSKITTKFTYLMAII